MNALSPLTLACIAIAAIVASASVRGDKALFFMILAFLATAGACHA